LASRQPAFRLPAKRLSLKEARSVDSVKIERPLQGWTRERLARRALHQILATNVRQSSATSVGAGSSAAFDVIKVKRCAAALANLRYGLLSTRHLSNEGPIESNQDFDTRKRRHASLLRLSRMGTRRSLDRAKWLASRVSNRRVNNAGAVKSAAVLSNLPRQNHPALVARVKFCRVSQATAPAQFDPASNWCWRGKVLTRQK
jgi:hypothetical protein